MMNEGPKFTLERLEELRDAMGNCESDVMPYHAEQGPMDGPSQKPSVPPMAPSMVDHPPHYLGHPSGIECIQVTEHMTFCLGNAVKYIWRAGLKGDAKEDLQKAVWYIQREMLMRESRRTTS